LLEHAIEALNVPVVKAIFDNNMTTMEYELTARNERNRIAPQPPSLTDSQQPFRIMIVHKIPYAPFPKSLEIVDILAKNGYDVCTMIRRPNRNIVPAPIWSSLRFEAPPVMRLFENYRKPIYWYGTTKYGQTSKLVRDLNGKFNKFFFIN